MKFIADLLETAFFADLALRFASGDEGPCGIFFGVGADCLEC